MTVGLLHKRSGAAGWSGRSRSRLATCSGAGRSCWRHEGGPGGKGGARTSRYGAACGERGSQQRGTQAGERVTFTSRQASAAPPAAAARRGCTIPCPIALVQPTAQWSPASSEESHFTMHRSAYRHTAPVSPRCRWLAHSCGLPPRATRASPPAAAAPTGRHTAWRPARAEIRGAAGRTWHRASVSLMLCQGARRPGSQRQTRQKTPWPLIPGCQRALQARQETASTAARLRSLQTGNPSKIQVHDTFLKAPAVADELPCARYMHQGVSKGLLQVRTSTFRLKIVTRI